MPNGGEMSHEMWAQQSNHRQPARSAPESTILGALGLFSSFDLPARERAAFWDGGEALFLAFMSRLGFVGKKVIKDEFKDQKKR